MVCIVHAIRQVDRFFIHSWFIFSSFWHEIVCAIVILWFVLLLSVCECVVCSHLKIATITDGRLSPSTMHWTARSDSYFIHSFVHSSMSHLPCSRTACVFCAYIAAFDPFYFSYFLTVFRNFRSYFFFVFFVDGSPPTAIDDVFLAYYYLIYTWN